MMASSYIQGGQAIVKSVDEQETGVDLKMSNRITKDNTTTKNGEKGE